MNDSQQTSKPLWEKVLTLEESGLVVEVSRAQGRGGPARYSLFVGMRYPSGKIFPDMDLSTRTGPGLNKPELALKYAVLLGHMLAKAQEHIETEMITAWDLRLERQRQHEQTRSQVPGQQSFVRAPGKTAREKAKKRGGHPP